jgi:transcriptional regulator with XRE-family HTH domain
VQLTQEWLTRPGGLTEALRLIRQSARLNGTELARRLGWARSKISKIENGQQLPSLDDIIAWCGACGMPGEVERLEDMLATAETAQRRFRLQVGRGGHVAVQHDLDRLMHQATLIRVCQITLIPGLLQTPEYARYPLQQAMAASGDLGDVENAVAARMRRQEILYEPGREFEFIIMEAALRLRPCPDEAMFGALDKLRQLTSLPRVTIRVVPNEALLSATPIIAFTQLDDQFTYLETHTAETVLEDPQDTYVYLQLADQLRDASVTGDAARELIRAASRLRMPAP